MPQTVTAASVILEARRRADAETLDAVQDFVTDVELLTYLSKAYRQFLDLIIACGDAAIGLLVDVTTLTAPYTLPADFYRLVGVDAPNDTQYGEWMTLRPFQFAQRNDYSDTNRPRYRIVKGAFQFSPAAAAPAQLRVWYLAFPDDLELDADTLSSFNGWDDFLVGALAAAICVKEDRDPSPHLAFQGQAAERIRQAASVLSPAETLTIAEVEHQWEEIYDLL